MTSTRVITLDCGASRVISGVFVSGPAGVWAVERLAIEPHDGERSAWAEWLENTRRALAALRQRERVRGEAWVGIPGHLTLVKFIRTPAIAAASRSRIIAFEAAQSLPLPLGELAWDHVLLAEDGGELEVMLAAARRAAIEGLGGALAATGWRVGGFVPSAAALVEGVRASPDLGDAPFLHIDIGARTSQLLFWHRARFVVRTVFVGGERLTDFVARRLGIEFAAAERVKRRVLGGRTDAESSPAELAAVTQGVMEFAEQLGIEVMRTLLGGVRRARLAPPETLRFTGGGSASPAIRAAIGERLQLQLRVEPSGSSPEAERRSQDADRAGESARLQLRGLAAAAGGASVVELSPPAWRRERAAQRRRPYWVGAAALLAVALLPPAIRAWQSAARAEQRVQAAEVKLEPVRRMARAAAARATELDDVRRRIQTFEQRERMRSHWLRLFADLERRFDAVGDAWIDRLGVDPHAGAEAGELRLQISGRLLESGAEGGNRETVQQRLGRLLASLAQSEFVAVVEPEQFEQREGQVLGFTATLALRPWR